MGAGGGIAVLVAALMLAPNGLGANFVTVTHKAPYNGGVLPTISTSTYSCNSAASSAWNFNLKTGFGGGSAHDSAKACPQNAYRLGSYSSASASGSEEVSILLKVPKGIHNVSAHLQINFTSVIKEANGSATGHCPSTRTSSIFAQYYNGTAYTNYPSLSRPIVYNNSTYFYYSHTVGATGSCASVSSVDGGVIAFMVASNGLAGYSATPSVFQFGGRVSTIASIY